MSFEEGLAEKLANSLIKTAKQLCCNGEHQLNEVLGYSIERLKYTKWKLEAKIYDE